MFSFGEHIRELTIKFTSIFKIRLGNTMSISVSKGRYLGHLSFDYYCNDKSSLDQPLHQVIHIQIMLLSYISFDFSP